MTDLPVGIGEILASKYRIDRVLGVGGMGVVVAAHHLQLDERVALKFLLDDAAARPDLVARFLREARASAKIRNDHVARVTDVGQLDSGIPFMVMEYLEGQDLDALIEAGPIFAVPYAVDLVLQACEAIADAHALGIIHRDLKPANLFVIRQSDGTPFVKVLDFGISKSAATEADPSLTGAGALGSPSYMSPEQMLHSQSVDARTDIWAVGVVLYELLTRRPPFEGTTIPEISAKIAASPHTPVKSLRPDVPDALSAVIDRTLAKRPEQRYASIAELARALLPFGLAESLPSVRRIEATAGSLPSSSRADSRESSRRLLLVEVEPTIAAPVVSAAVSAASGGSSAASEASRAPAGRSRRRLLLGVAMGFGVVVATTTAATLASKRAPPKADAITLQPNAPPTSVSVVATGSAVGSPVAVSSARAVDDATSAAAPTAAPTARTPTATPPTTTSARSNVPRFAPAAPTASARNPTPAASTAPNASNPFDSRK